MADIFVYGFAFFFVFTHLPVWYVLGQYVLRMKISPLTSPFVLSIHTIYLSCRQKREEFWPVILHEFVPIVAFTYLCYAWLQSPYSYILSGEHLILFITTTGIIFGRIASKVIIAHLTKSHFPTFSNLIMPIAAGVLLVEFPRLLHM